MAQLGTHLRGRKCCE